jgi:hypothetical protein
MGVDVDKYFGYVIDITEQTSKLKSIGEDDFWEKYMDGENLSQELIDLGYVADSYPKYPTANDITLIYDGMSGNYCKLIYIVTVERDSYDYSETNEELNKVLANVPVQDDIKEKMWEAYRLIFGDRLCPNIKAEQFSHFH